MSAYNQIFNTDSSKIRYIIVATVAELQNKLFFYNIFNQQKHRVDIPFFYSVAGDERFVQDNFLKDFTGSYTGIQVYDQVPRGVINLTGISIKSGELVNKFIRTQINVLEEGELKPYSYETMVLPIGIEFDVKIILNSTIEMFKCTESIFDNMYKNMSYQVDFGGYRIPACISIPEDVELNRLLEFTFSDEKVYELNFSMHVDSFYPVFVESSRIFVGKKTNKMDLNIKDISQAPLDEVLKNLTYNKNIIENADGFLASRLNYGNTEVK